MLLSIDRTSEGGYGSINQGASDLTGLFRGQSLLLANKIIDKWGQGYTRPREKYCQPRERYCNLKHGRRTKAQLHPNSPGVDIAIAEGSVQNWNFNVLTPVSIEQLNGYNVPGPNKNWMKGIPKPNNIWTRRPAAAFNVPVSLLGNPNHPGWSELEALIAFAVQR